VNVYTTEEEQIKRIRDFLKNYGSTVLLSVVLAVAGSSAFRYWQNHHEKVATFASYSYEAMLISMFNNNDLDTKTQAQYLISQYPDTPYAQLGALELAKLAIESNDLASADTQLQWIMHHAKTPSLKQVARIRDARVLIMMKKPDEALKLLNTIDDKGYLSEIDSVRGDAYIAKGDVDKASDYYQQAKKDLPPDSLSASLTTMKQNNLAVSQSGAITTGDNK